MVIRHSVLDVVDGNVIAEHGPRVNVGLLDGRAGEADEDAFGKASRRLLAKP